MKFRNPKTGEIYDVTEKTDSLITGFCMGIWCGGCPIIKHTNGRMLCVDWVNEHPHTAARMMGYEVIEHDGCVSESGPGDPGEPGEPGFIPIEAKADGGKPRPTLVPPSLMEAVTAIREYGCSKYHGPDKWKRVERQRYWEATLRHALEAWDNYEAIDDESGLPHLAHMACNIAFILQIMKENKHGKSY